MILKTYVRIFTNHIQTSLDTHRQVFPDEPHIRRKFGEWKLIGSGNVMFVDGMEKALAPIRDSHEPFIVDDLDGVQRRLAEAGAEITGPISPAPTGQCLYARHPDI